MSVSLARHRFTADQFQRMVRTGIIEEDARVELIQGDIVDITPLSDPHVATVNWLNRFFSRNLPEEAIVSVQGTINVNPLNVLQPDLAILRFRDDFYAQETARPEETHLVIEVSGTSLRFDRHTKLPLYAAAGIAEYWIANLEAMELEIYREPEGDGYKSTRILKMADSASPLEFPELTVPVAEVFGPISRK